jgi:hypothetical protein
VRLKEYWQETERLRELFEQYNSWANNDYALSIELEKKRWGDDLIDAFVTYIKWNMLPSLNIDEAVYKSAKDTLAEHGLMQKSYLPVTPLLRAN